MPPPKVVASPRISLADETKTTAPPSALIAGSMLGAFAGSPRALVDSSRMLPVSRSLKKTRGIPRANSTFVRLRSAGASPTR